MSNGISRKTEKTTKSTKYDNMGTITIFILSLFHLLLKKDILSISDLSFFISLFVLIEIVSIEITAHIRNTQPAKIKKSLAVLNMKYPPDYLNFYNTLYKFFFQKSTIYHLRNEKIYEQNRSDHSLKIRYMRKASRRAFIDTNSAFL